MKSIRKKYTQRLAAAALAGAWAMTSAAWADVTLLTFDTPPGLAVGAAFGSWTSGTITPGTTSYDVSASGYGGQYVDVAPDVDATGNSNIEVTVNLTVPSGTAAAIVTLGDADGTEWIYEWYGLTSGAQVLLKPLSAHAAVSVPGTTPGLDLANLSYVFIQGNGNPYTIQWQNLRITGPPARVTVSSFDNYVSDAKYDSWASVTPVSGPTSYSITATGGGSNYKYIGFPVIAGAGQTTLQLTVTISGLAEAASVSPFVKLLDGDPGANTASYIYSWPNLINGHYVLTLPVQSPTTIETAGNHGGLNLETLTHSHIGVDTGGLPTTYTISWEDLSLTSSSATAIQITKQSYDPASHQFSLTWTSENGATYTVETATDLAGGFTTLETGVVSGGSTTTHAVTLTNPNRSFVRIRKQ